MATNSIATRDTTAVARQSDNPMVKFRGQLEQRANEFKMVLPSHITPEKFQRTVMTAVQGDPELLRADRQSLVLACMKAAQDGLLPDKREAALVIFSTRQKQDGEWVSVKLVQYMPMVFGLRKKILQSGEISAIETNVVYRAEAEGGAFIYEAGTEAMLRHRPMLELTDEQTADDQIVAAYSVAVMKDGTKSFEVMRRSEINKVREKSQTGATVDRYGKPRQPSGPWVDWFAEMARKTVMRRHSKTLPMSGDLLDVEARDDDLAARSATALLGAVDADAPTPLPPTREEVARAEGADPETGEIDEDAARALDREAFAAMEGRRDEDHGDQHDDDGDIDDEDVHPGEALADQLIERLSAATVMGDVIMAEQDLAKHEQAMREGDVERVKVAAANARKGFGK